MHVLLNLPAIGTRIFTRLFGEERGCALCTSAFNRHQKTVSHEIFHIVPGINTQPMLGLIWESMAATGADMENVM